MIHPKVQVIGIGAEGLSSVSGVALQQLQEAEVLVGNDRQLALLDDTIRGERRLLPSPLLSHLDSFLAELAGKKVAFVASGDPMVSGIGATLIRRLGKEKVEVHPNISSAALARARMGWSWRECQVVSIVGHNLHSLARYLLPDAKLIVLLARPHTPAVVAEFVANHGYGRSKITVLENLGARDERIYVHDQPVLGQGCPKEENLSYQHPELARLYLVAIEVYPDRDFTPLPLTPGLPDQVYQNSQVTKRVIRAITLAGLAPFPGQMLWDIGAGAGSISIEWCRLDSRNRAVAIEVKPERIALIKENVHRLAVTNQVQILLRDAADSLTDLPDPDAVFIGGGCDLNLIRQCWTRLPEGGRLAANSVTAESNNVLFQAYQEFGGDLQQVSVATAKPLGSYTGFTPARMITTWSVVKLQD